MRFTRGTRLIHCYGLFVLLLAMPQYYLWADDKITAFVSVLPQQLFVERIGGSAVDVEVMVKPGFSPATYEPTPRQISALSRTQLYFRIGVPFEQAWMPRIRSVNPAMKVVDAREGLELRELADHHHREEDHEHLDHEHHEAADKSDKGSDEHSAAKSADKSTDKPASKSKSKPESKSAVKKEFDPHLWTSPQLVIQMAEQIREELTRLQPEHSARFTENHAALVAELEVLDAELRELFDGKNKQFMVFHPSWGYFADAYGLTQIAIEFEGKEPGARALSKLIKQARQTGVKTIFVQPQFDGRAAKQLAKAIGGDVVAIDPLAADYFANMRRVGRLIAGVDDE